MNTPAPIHPILQPEQEAVEKRAVLLRLVRMTFFIVFFTVAALSYMGISVSSADSLIKQPLEGPIAVVVAVGLGIIVGVIDYLTPRKKISTISAVFFGLFAAMLATLAFSYVIDLLVRLYDIKMPNLVLTIKGLVGIALSYLGITTVLQTQDDFRLVIPYVEFAKQLRGPRPLLLDSSALIDARILDIGMTGVLQAPLVIPRFVIGELQQLSDSDDSMKRARGRRGLDVIAKLQRSAALDVSVDETFIPGKAVDQMLVELARQMSAMVVTNDVALARVAGIQNVPILNINQLANALKPAFVPGEQLRLKLIRQGEQQSQGVGYLEDGTMVVAEDGFGFIGQEVALTVTSVLQTNAGRLVFGRIDSDGPRSPSTETAATTAPGSDQPEGNPEPASQYAETPATPDTSKPRSPFPPKPPRSVRSGTPRNPRR